MTVADLESTQGSGYSLASAAAPAVVYRRLTERTRECLTISTMRVDADFFTDTQTGRVSLVQSAIGMVITTTRIEPGPSGGSLLRVSYYDPAKRGRPPLFTESIEAWANGQPGECTADRYKPSPGLDPRPDQDR